MKTAALYLSLVPLLASGSPLSIETIHKDAAPVLSSTHAKAIPNAYLIKFKDHVKHEDATAHHSWVQSVHLSRETERMELRKRSQIPIVDEVLKGLRHTYNIGGSFLGYSGHFDEDTIEEIRRHPDVSTQSHTREDLRKKCTLMPSHESFFFFDIFGLSYLTALSLALRDTLQR